MAEKLKDKLFKRNYDTDNTKDHFILDTKEKLKKIAWNYIKFHEETYQ